MLLQGKTYYGLVMQTITRGLMILSSGQFLEETHLRKKNNSYFSRNWWEAVIILLSVSGAQGSGSDSKSVLVLEKRRFALVLESPRNLLHDDHSRVSRKVCLLTLK